jgi:hypothetical protein
LKFGVKVDEKEEDGYVKQILSHDLWRGTKTNFEWVSEKANRERAAAGERGCDCELWLDEVREIDPRRWLNSGELDFCGGPWEGRMGIGKLLYKHWCFVIPLLGEREIERRWEEGTREREWEDERSFSVNTCNQLFACWTLVYNRCIAENIWSK